MTQPNADGPTPSSVAGPATTTAPVAKNGPMVIGVFGPEQNLTAMVRMPGGKTVTVNRGQRLRGKQVVRIDTDGLVLAQGGREERLALP